MAHRHRVHRSTRRNPSARFATLATDLGITFSVGRTGVSWDNAVAESFCATIKSDLLHRRTLPTRAPVSRRASRRDPAR